MTDKTWPEIIDINPNPNIPRARDIEECCGSVLMTPDRYEHAKRCVNMLVGLNLDQVETLVKALRDTAKYAVSEEYAEVNISERALEDHCMVIVEDLKSKINKDM